jgi:hypothetical protein
MIKIDGTPSEYLLPRDHGLMQAGRYALIIGAVAAVLCAIGYFTNPTQFFRSYLIAYLYWLGPVLGAMGLVMIQHISGGRWGVAIRRICDAGMRTIPFMAVLFVPVIGGMHELYEWTHADAVAADPVLQYKSFYLNETFFHQRAAGFFAVWLIVGFFLARWSKEQDDAPQIGVHARLHNLARGGILLYAMTMTFAAFDWGMSLEPHWFSHIYGVIIIGGQILTAMLFATLIASRMIDLPKVAEFVDSGRFHDLGNLLLAFIMLWAYFALSQFLIIWSGNLPEETPWYLAREAGGWGALAVFLIAFHFVIPFMILLNKALKRTPKLLARVVMFLLFMRFVDLYWFVAPSFSPGSFSIHWLDLTAMAAIGGLWFAVFVQLLKSRPVLPLGDPYHYLDEEEEL